MFFVDKRIKSRQALFTFFLAIIFWYVTFGMELLNFWYSMAIATVVLALLAIIFGGKPFTLREVTFRSVVIGVLSAAILYGIFWIGNFAASYFFDFAPCQINSIYSIRNQGELWLILMILLFVTSPAEEIYWRGFLQRWLSQRTGDLAGWIIGALLYSAVHLFSGNFMLVMAALVAGLFWGFIYAIEESVVPLIISHCLWTVTIFVLFPVG